MAGLPPGTMIGLALQLWLLVAQPSPVTLSYDVYTSAGADPRGTLPTVVLLHGRDDALHGLPRALRRSSVPMRVVVAWGPRVQRDGRHAWFRRSEARVRGGRSNEVSAAAGHVAELLGHLQASGAVAGDPVLVGYSQGAVVALEVALQAPESVGEVVAISGHLPPGHLPDALARHAVTHVLVGEKDRVMSAKVSRGQVEHLRRLGYEVDAEGLNGQGHVMGPKMRKMALRKILSAVQGQAEG